MDAFAPSNPPYMSALKQPPMSPARKFGRTASVHVGAAEPPHASTATPIVHAVPAEALLHAALLSPVLTAAPLPLPPAAATIDESAPPVESSTVVVPFPLDTLG